VAPKWQEIAKSATARREKAQPTTGRCRLRCTQGQVGRRRLSGERPGRDAYCRAVANSVMRGLAIALARRRRKHGVIMCKKFRHSTGLG
jgi:hypothetical protein